MRKIKNWQYLFIFVFILLGFCFLGRVLNAESLPNPTDIEGHWAAKQITDWTSKGLVGGYPDGTFKPNNKITRAEFIALVNRAFGYTKTSPFSFSDVAEKDWYASEIAKAKAVGYIGGYPDGTIKPNNPISRQEVAAILTKILKPQNVPIGSTLMFTDAKNIPQWSKSAIEAVLSSGYMGGYPDNTFQPTKSITRAESISVLDRAMGVLYNQAGINGYGAEQETMTIAGNVTISRSGVTLKNTVINGNLYLTEGIGDGHVTLENVQVKGTTKVSGGGENSIIFSHCRLGTVLVDVPDKSRVRLGIQGSMLNTLIIDSAATVTDQGVIQTAYINVNGVVIEIRPTTLKLAEGIEALIAGKMVSERESAEENVLGDDAALFGGGVGFVGGVGCDDSSSDDPKITTAAVNNAPIVREGQATQTGTATLADSGEAIEVYSADVSAWFTDADTEDVLTYTVVSAQDGEGVDVSANVTLAGNLLTYAPIAAQAEKTVTIVVKANDGKADSTGNVTITVTVAAVPDTADLTKLELSGSPVNYVFSGNQYTYEGVRVASGVENITVTPTGAGEITVTVGEKTETVTSGGTFGAIALEAGVEKIIVVVAKETGKTAKTYTIKVTRAIADESKVPQNLVAATGDRAISLTWDAVIGAASYKVYRSTQSGTGYVEIASGITDSPYESTGLEVGKRYYYKVAATVDSTDGVGGGDSDLSAEVTAIANVDDQGTVYYGDWLLVSNESTNITLTQSTGTLSMGNNSINSTSQQLNITNISPAGLELEAYRINPVLPYEPTKGINPIERNLMMSAPEPSVLGESREFNVYDFKTETYGLITASLAYIGERVEIWVGCNTTIEFTDEMAKQIGEEFDGRIYPLVTENFYTESDVNKDGRIAILCYDIQDDYSPEWGGGYVGGYFWGGDLYEKTIEPDSNQMEIFYIDTYPTMGTNTSAPDVGKAYSTLAHEFQHMVNYNCNMFIEKQEGETARQMETWLNEALSMAAEYMYNGVQQGRITWYKNSAGIGDGRSLLDWESDGNILDNYALSYLFGQYLRTQVEQALGKEHEVKIFREIIEDPVENHVAVENVIKKHINAELSFGEFMTNFRAAMLLKAATGYYGFGGETAFDALSTPLYTGEGTELYGGGAVVKQISSPPFTEPAPADKGDNVQYRGIFQPKLIPEP